MSIRELKDFSKRNGASLLIVSEENVKYYTGFSSSNGWLIVDGASATFFTDSRYIEAAQSEIKTVDEVLETKGFDSTIVPFLKKSGVSKLCVEQSRLTLDKLERFRKSLSSFEFDLSSSLDDEINFQRSAKSEEEVRLITKAQRIAEKGFDHILTFIRPGLTEKEVRLELDYFMLRNGADDLSFETIAVAGANGSKPHGVPGDYVIKSGDFITLDFGAVCGGYHSDMTRTVAVGAVSDMMAEVYQTVLEAQLEGIRAIRPGAICRDVDKAARDVIEKAGFGEFFGHSFGHGVGVEIHEHPFESSSSEEILRVGNVVTAEPGIYLPGSFGVRIEDMLLVTEDGSRNLTESKKDLIVI